MRNKALKLVTREQKHLRQWIHEKSSYRANQKQAKKSGTTKSRKTESWSRLEESKNIWCYIITRSKAIEQVKSQRFRSLPFLYSFFTRSLTRFLQIPQRPIFFCLLTCSMIQFLAIPWAKIFLLSSNLLQDLIYIGFAVTSFFVLLLTCSMVCFLVVPWFSISLLASERRNDLVPKYSMASYSRQQIYRDSIWKNSKNVIQGVSIFILKTFGSDRTPKNKCIMENKFIPKKLLVF